MTDVPEPAKKALSRAAYMLSKRAYSKEELYHKLCEKGVNEKDAAYAVKRLSELNLLSDEAYAGAIIRTYCARGYGIYRIRQELKRRLIPCEVIDSLLSETPDPAEKIESYIRQKLKDRTPDRREIKRISDALSRRGFSYDDIARALRKFRLEDEYAE